jgi:hypothetical protein
MRVWLIASGAVFAISMGLLVFFDMTDYGFLYNGALLWVCYVSFIVLLMGLAVWLCGRLQKRKVRKALASVACALLILVWSYLCLAFVLIEGHTGTTSTDAGSILANRDRWVHTSPEGTNRIVVFHASTWIFAYPMRNRWIYKEVKNGTGWWEEIEDGYTVEWPSEQQAVVTVEGENPSAVNGENQIIVDFKAVRK